MAGSADLKLRIGLIVLVLLATIPIGVLSVALVVSASGHAGYCINCAITPSIQKPLIFSLPSIVYELLWLAVLFVSVVVSYLYKNKWQNDAKVRRIDRDFLARLGSVLFGIVVGFVIGFGYELSFLVASLPNPSVLSYIFTDVSYLYIVATVLFLIGIFVSYKYKSKREKAFGNKNNV